MGDADNSSKWQHFVGTGAPRLLSPPGESDEWMHLSPINTRMHGKWLKYAKSTSQYSLAVSLKVRNYWSFEVNPLCCRDITRSDRQIGNWSY